MKRTFLSRRNALLTSASFSAGIIMVGIAVLVLAVRLLLPNIFYSLMWPVARMADSIGGAAHAVFGGFADASALSLRNEELAKENAALAEENRALSARIDDQDSLSPGIAASVVNRPPSSPYDMLLVAAGSRQGVSAGMEALAPGGVPAGVVTDVLPDFSRVALFSSPTMTFDAWVGQKHLAVRVTGAGGGAFKASISRLAGVTEGDVVYVAAGSAVPIGTVVRVDSDPSSPTAALQIQGLVNPYSLTSVSLKAAGAAFVGALDFKNAESL